MAIDNRDWYRVNLRKKARYVERAAFRRPVFDKSEYDGRDRRSALPHAYHQPSRPSKLKITLWLVVVCWLIWRLLIKS